MTDVLIPRFMAQAPLLASFFADTSRDTFYDPPIPLVPPAETTPPFQAHCDVIAVAPLPPLPPKASPVRSRKRKASDPKHESSQCMSQAGDLLSEEERNLRMAEATILFPKYVACQNSKRVKLNSDSKR